MNIYIKLKKIAGNFIKKELRKNVLKERNFLKKEEKER